MTPSASLPALVPLTLYYHPLASYCHKVLIALYENGIAFTPRLVEFGNAADQAALTALWPLGQFPVLHDAGRAASLLHAQPQVVPESSIVIEYLDQHCAPAQRMVPAEPAAALQVRLWDRIFDNHVHTPMQEIVFDRIRGSTGDMTSARNTLQTAYALIDAQLASGGDWIAGADFTLADCAAAPALFFAHTLEAFPEPLVHLQAYFERLIARPSVARVLQEAKPYLHFYPFHSNIPARFL
jgi:glutathione S-transferase